MCVLVVADKRRPTEDEMEKMALTNPDGAGIAWREGGEVKWEKGLNLAEISEINKEAPLPYVLHFRIASCGGKSQEMTHPFPLERDVSLTLSGTTKGFVLFHNGHWPSWRDRGLDTGIKEKLKVPDGKWSDTRVMAWLAHLHGHSILEFIDEKVILFGMNKIEIFHPEGWYRVDDLLVSNRLWENRYIRKPDEWDYMHQHGGEFHASVCRMVACQENSIGATWYCAKHQPACRWQQCNKPKVVGSEHCIEHQPLCTDKDCKNPRIYGETHCIQHLNKREARLLMPRDPAEVPDMLKDPALQEQSKWARSINGKVM